jgi:hypothetical protein
MIGTERLVRYRGVTDPRLGRHVRHDSRSLAYPYFSTGAPVQTVQHQRLAPIFDQGNLGSCVPNAGVGTLGYAAYAVSTLPLLSFTEGACLEYYRKVTRADPFEGAWEPDDTGSDGLSMAKVFLRDQLISGYQHVFDPGQFMDALMHGPVMCGTVWRNDMFDPGPGGLITVSGAVAGGHEYIANGYNTDTGLIRFDNSWGTGWGEAGSFRMHRDDFFLLLADDGDATVLVPLDQPAPTPIDPQPVPPTHDPELLRLAKAVKTWRHRAIPAIGAKTAQSAVNRYLNKKGF